MLRVIENFRARLVELLPKRPNGDPIKAWNEMAAWLQDLHERVVRLEGVASPGDPPPPPPPPPPQGPVAPRTYNKSAGGDARFCTAGLPRNEDGQPFDRFSTYDDNGLSHGGRDPDRQVPGLKPSNEMDGRGPCDPYGPFPPWPAESYER